MTAPLAPEPTTDFNASILAMAKYIGDSFNAMAPGSIGALLSNTGNTGAATATRWIGGTAGASPTGGPWLVGDWAIDTTTPTIWICTVAGSPGTWVQNQANGVAASSVTFAMLAAAVQQRTLTNMESATNQHTYCSDLPTSATFLTISGTAYAVYIGRATQASTLAHVNFQLTSSGVGVTKTSELGIFSAPSDPNGATQTLTKVKAQDLSTTDFTGATGTYKVAFSQALTANTHYYLVTRFAYATGPTQPTFTGRMGDIGTGRILVATPGALTGLTTQAFTVPTDAGAALAPDMVATTY